MAHAELLAALEQSRRRAEEVARRITRDVEVEKRPADYTARLYRLSRCISFPSGADVKRCVLKLLQENEGEALQRAKKTGARVELYGSCSFSHPTSQGDRMGSDEPLRVQLDGSRPAVAKAEAILKALLFTPDGNVRVPGTHGRGQEAARKDFLLTDSLYDSKLAAGDGFRSVGGSSTTMKIPRHSVGTVIGRGGDTVRQVQDNSGARVQVSKEDDRDADTRTLVIEGTEHQITMAKEAILALLRDGDSRNDIQVLPGQEKETLEVPHDAVGLIIGRGGQTIRQIQDDSGCQVNISRDQSTRSSARTRTVVFVGSADQIHRAKSMVMSYVDETPAIRPGEKERQLKVPKEAVGYVIGRGGETIRQIQESSGATVKVDRDERGPYRTVVIFGLPYAVDQAERQVNAMVDEHVQKHGGQSGGVQNAVGASSYGFNEADYYTADHASYQEVVEQYHGDAAAQEDPNTQSLSYEEQWAQYYHQYMAAYGTAPPEMPHGPNVPPTQ